MFAQRGRGLARRLSAAVLVTGLVAAGAISGAGAAAALDAPDDQSGAVATLDGLKTYDRAVLRTPAENGAPAKVTELPAGLFEMTVDGGGKLKTYGIDVHNPTQDQAKYLETPWAQTSLGANKNAGKIRWILQHSYPQVDDLVGLAKEAGTGPLSEKTAAAGTQVAVWRYSDNAAVEALDPQAEKLADWLQKKARTAQEPRASLTLEPAAVSGKSGHRLGPVTVRTTARRVAVAPPADAAANGIRVVDKKGRPVKAAANGAQLFFDVPSTAVDGTASLAVQATASVPVGRVFAGLTKSQTQILAGSSQSTVTARASATWAKEGAIPALTARKNCADGGVDITAVNKGDQPFTFELLDTEHAIPAGLTRTATVPVREDQAYDFTITGPGGLSRNFEGVLDCRTSGSPAGGMSAQLTRQSAPGEAAGLPAVRSGGENLAETGGSSTTPMIAAAAIALLLVGGAAVVLTRRKKENDGGE
ncbi:LAETG motif-containing sortase-dependent surface protein [Streptomyces sp. NPDC050504]|uniref:LAETG motif-containing sortase-dependent surface protein n=1 Tax=Streptomyces sp. NPDC050504 TaxID=3365618 RepID=UPI003792284A